MPSRYPCISRKQGYHAAGFHPPDQWDEFPLQEFDGPWYRRAEWYPWVKKIPNPPRASFDWGILDHPESAFGDQKAIQFGIGFRRPEDPRGSGK
ncbi:MAG: hypothetical protein LC126_25385 [Bryobacterales bacterium]|nr:hypothetical protein [Bryobacterales bacterium]